MTIVSGIYFRGVGRASRFIRLYTSRISKATGMTPAPGTFNLRADPKLVTDALAGLQPIIIDEFLLDGKTYGKIQLFPARIRSVQCYLVRPERTKYDPSVLEIIAPVPLREKFDVRDGNSINVEF